MTQEALHHYTLMVETPAEILDIPGGPEIVEVMSTVYLSCPECPRYTEVDKGLHKRGDYFCNGTEEMLYRRHKPGEPSILEVFGEPMVKGPALERLVWMRNALVQISDAAADLGERLEDWIYIHGTPDK